MKFTAESSGISAKMTQPEVLLSLAALHELGTRLSSSSGSDFLSQLEARRTITAIFSSPSQLFAIDPTVLRRLLLEQAAETGDAELVSYLCDAVGLCLVQSLGGDATLGASGTKGWTADELAMMFSIRAAGEPSVAETLLTFLAECATADAVDSGALRAVAALVRLVLHITPSSRGKSPMQLSEHQRCIESLLRRAVALGTRKHETSLLRWFDVASGNNHHDMFDQHQRVIAFLRTVPYIDDPLVSSGEVPCSDSSASLVERILLRMLDTAIQESDVLMQLNLLYVGGCMLKASLPSDTKWSASGEEATGETEPTPSEHHDAIAALLSSSELTVADFIGASVESSDGVLFPFACRAVAAFCWHSDSAVRMANSAAMRYAPATLLRWAAAHVAPTAACRGSLDESVLVAVWEVLSALATCAEGRILLAASCVCGDGKPGDALADIAERYAARESLGMRIALIEYWMCVVEVLPFEATCPRDDVPQKHLESEAATATCRACHARIFRALWSLKENTEETLRVALWHLMEKWLLRERLEERQHAAVGSRRTLVVSPTCASMLSGTSLLYLNEPAAVVRATMLRCADTLLAMPSAEAFHAQLEVLVKKIGLYPIPSSGTAYDLA